MELGCKPRDAWHIGTEHEKFAYCRADYRPLPYEAEQEGQPSIRALLEGMQRFDWEPVLAAGRVIALRRSDGSSVTLEPGGKFELSGAQLQTIHQTFGEVIKHFAHDRVVCSETGAGVITPGFHKYRD